ncbi:RNA polymerase sigma factor [Pantoea ananatis]|uniref:RNA polymerase sigma factor n=1 Tax=Pantoea ananas TaxID=553 RepID=UPI0021B38ACE|nr:sigma-70 family RNA polymerase sigma factor [Pantoea ananatis]
MMTNSENTGYTNNTEISYINGTSNIDWEKILCEQNRRLYNFIRKRIASHEDVEDIVQTTCLEVLRNSHKFLGTSKPETWVFGIAANLVRNYYKTNYNRQSYEVLNEELTNELIVDGDPSNIIVNNQLLTIIVNSIDKLSSDTQEMLIMIIDQNGSYHDVANTLNIPVGTVKSRLSRLRETLKSRIAC